MLGRTLASAVIIVALGVPALAQQNPCTQRQQVLRQLASQYEEAPVAMGLANNGGVIEVLSSGDRSTWTIIITMPDGITCMIAAGESWEPLPIIRSDSGI